MTTQSRTNPTVSKIVYFITDLSRRVTNLMDSLLVGRDRLNLSVFDVSHLDLTLPHLDPAFEGYRVTHISDLHVDTWLSVSRLEKVIPLINEQAADMIVITGDFVSDRHPDIIEGMRSALMKLKAPDGIFAIFGNHDYMFAYDDLSFLMATSHITHLRAGFKTIRRGGASLHIAGIDDMPNKRLFLERLIQQMPAEGAAILLMHKPDFADVSAPTGRFDLSLSGHTHGGQIVIPGYGPLFKPEGGKKYHTGLYKVGEMWQYTTRGLGTADFPLRINCPPEISVLTLHAPS